MLRLLLCMMAAFLAFSFIHYAARSKKPFKRAFLSIFIGLLTMVLVNLFSSLTGVYIPVTELSVLVCAVGGVPGTALMVMLTML